MNTIHSLLFIIHIIFGSMALILFWVPIVTKKGGLDHRKFGRHYANTMYAVAASGALMALMVIFAPLVIKHQLVNENTDTKQLVLNLRIFWSFLLYLSLLTFVNVRHGILVLKNKKKHSNMRQWPHLFSIGLLLVGGLLLFSLGITYSNTLHIIFGVLGTVLAIQSGRFCLAKSVPVNRWLVEHIGSSIGSGIGAYTAFMSFGGRSMFGNIGEWQFVFWVAPGVIGAIASARMSRKYKHGLAAKS
ncbi:MAG: hypothetical protein ACI9LE_000443 [Paraglaciecola sp.]|jgi:hypothetical protein